MLTDKNKKAIAGRVRVCLGYAEQLRKAQTQAGSISSSPTSRSGVVSTRKTPQFAPR